MKTQEGKLREINDVLVALIRNINKTNNEIIKKEKFSMPEFYTGLRKLQLLRRVDPKNNRKVVNSTAITMEEYQSVGDPYGKRNKTGKRKVKTPIGKAVRETTRNSKGGKRTKKADKTHDILTTPIDLKPIFPGEEITISGTAAGLAAFLQLLNK